jgi:hypothetical protein
MLRCGDVVMSRSEVLFADSSEQRDIATSRHRHMAGISVRL